MIHFDRFRILKRLSWVLEFTKIYSKSFGTEYSRMNQVKFVEDSL